MSDLTMNLNPTTEKVTIHRPMQGILHFTKCASLEACGQASSRTR